MTMNLYKLFSCNVETHYKGCFISKAMLFTVITTVLNVFLPFLVACRSRGFWLRTYSFYEQPRVHFTYEYLLVVETEDASRPVVCGAGGAFDEYMLNGRENCADMQVLEYDNNTDGTNDYIELKVHLIVPPHNSIISILLIMGLNYQLKTVCPLHMQSLAIISKEFPIPPSGFRYFGDIHLNQARHLPCPWNIIDTRHNSSLFNDMEEGKITSSVLDPILEAYFKRDVTTQSKTTFTRTQNSHTGNMDIQFSLRIPQTEVVYIPSIMQELKWAWPQYLSLFIVFYWIFDRIKRFVFKNRLVMAWEVEPWKK